jgi:hypothetical protein
MLPGQKEAHNNSSASYSGTDCFKDVFAADSLQTFAISFAKCFVVETLRYNSC